MKRWIKFIRSELPTDKTVVAYWNSYPANMQVGTFWGGDFYPWSGYLMSWWLDELGEIKEEWKDKITPFPFPPNYYFVLPNIGGLDVDKCK